MLVQVQGTPGPHPGHPHLPWPACSIHISQTWMLLAWEALPSQSGTPVFHEKPYTWSGQPRQGVRGGLTIPFCTLKPNWYLRSGRLMRTVVTGGQLTMLSFTCVWFFRPCRAWRQITSWALALSGSTLRRTEGLKAHSGPGRGCHQAVYCLTKHSPLGLPRGRGQLSEDLSRCWRLRSFIMTGY